MKKIFLGFLIFILSFMFACSKGQEKTEAKVERIKAETKEETKTEASNTSNVTEDVVKSICDLLSNESFLSFDNEYHLDLSIKADINNQNNPDRVNFDLSLLFDSLNNEINESSINLDVLLDYYNSSDDERINIDSSLDLYILANMLYIKANLDDELKETFYDNIGIPLIGLLVNPNYRFFLDDCIKQDINEPFIYIRDYSSLYGYIPININESMEYNIFEIYNKFSGEEISYNDLVDICREMKVKIIDKNEDTKTYQLVIAEDILEEYVGEAELIIDIVIDNKENKLIGITGKMDIDNNGNTGSITISLNINDNINVNRFTEEEIKSAIVPDIALANLQSKIRDKGNEMTDENYRCDYILTQDPSTGLVGTIYVSTFGTTYKVGENAWYCYYYKNEELANLAYQDFKKNASDEEKGLYYNVGNWVIYGNSDLKMFFITLYD